MRVTNETVQSVMLYMLRKYIINIYLPFVCAVALHPIMALRGSRGTAVLNRNLDTRWRWVVNFFFAPGKDTRNPLNCRLCGLQSRFRRFRGGGEKHYVSMVI